MSSRKRTWSVPRTMAITSESPAKRSSMSQSLNSLNGRAQPARKATCRVERLPKYGMKSGASQYFAIRPSKRMNCAKPPRPANSAEAASW